MRFLRKSLIGLFLFAATFGLFAFAIGMVMSAIEARAGKEDRRGGPPRERVFAVNVVPFEPGQIVPVLNVFGEVQSNRVLDIRPAVGGSIIALGDAFVDGGVVASRGFAGAD